MGEWFWYIPNKEMILKNKQTAVMIKKIDAIYWVDLVYAGHCANTDSYTTYVTVTQWDRYYPPFLGKETDAQRG